jgi:archaellum biogenesis ATPase FlaH
LAIVQDCITRFLNGAKAFVAQVAAVPGQIGATIDTLASSIQAGADELLGKQETELNGIIIPDSLSGLFTDPNLDHSNNIIQFVSDTYGNANTIMATVEASNFDPTKVQWA